MSPDAKPSKLLTTAELAELLNVNPVTIRADRVGENRLGLPYVRIGRSIRYQPEDVLCFLKKNRVAA